MNKAITIPFIIGITTASYQDQANTARFTVNIKNDGGEPLSAYPVQIGTFSHWQAGEGFGKDVWDKETKNTDAAGIVVFNHPSKNGEFGINCAPGLPKGYYMTWIPNHKFREVINGQWVPDNPKVEIILKRIKDPIPMYARNLTNEGGGGLRMPALDQDCGYDFELGDWVAPNGKGRTGDVIFHSAFTKDPSGDSKRVLRVSFPGVGDGLLAFDKDLLSGSELSSDYMAPTDGYQQTITFTRTIVNLKVTDDQSPTRNYYFRVRSKTDAHGRIVSANYGKIYGNFMSFIYYFNPNLNDRNVEFDPKRNLFQKLPENMRVTQP